MWNVPWALREEGVTQQQPALSLRPQCAIVELRSLWLATAPLTPFAPPPQPATPIPHTPTPTCDNPRHSSPILLWSPRSYEGARHESGGVLPALGVGTTVAEGVSEVAAGRPGDCHRAARNGTQGVGHQLPFQQKVVKQKIGPTKNFLIKKLFFEKLKCQGLRSPPPQPSPKSPAGPWGRARGWGWKGVAMRRPPRWHSGRIYMVCPPPSMVRVLANGASADRMINSLLWGLRSRGPGRVYVPSMTVGPWAAPAHTGGAVREGKGKGAGGEGGGEGAQANGDLQRPF